MPTPTGSVFVFSLIQYALLLPIMLWFAGRHDDGAGLARALHLTVTGLAYTALLVLPSALAAVAAECRRLSQRQRTRRLLWLAAGITAWLVQCYLIIDAAILRHFGFHFNGLVLNLLFTRGGIESMGLTAVTVIPAARLILALLGLHLALVITLTRRQARLAQSLQAWRPRPVLVFGASLVLFFCLLSSLFSFGLADFYRHANILHTVDAYPFVLTMRMRGFLRRLGLKTPKRRRQPSPVQLAESAAALHYPRTPITRKPDRSRPNVIWLVGESLRADLLSAETMPATWQFAADKHRFTTHYSGGNGTRAGMFSMFYGLYSNCWTHFLHAHQGPLLIKWLREDDYQFLCLTSARFTYPEFDRTLFAEVPQASMHEISDGEAWQRDILLTDRMLDFLSRHDTGQPPFFLFGFFESTHSPYTFPPDQALRDDYLKNLNFATVSAEDAGAIYNRAVNAAHHLDTQLARIYAALAERDLLRNTIVVITGDHGEEFYEKGYLGHNSTFSEEQIRTPLVLHLPGTEPEVQTKTSHHTDIIPTLAPFFGVTNPPEDFSVGDNLLDPNRERDYFVVCGWEIATFVNQTHKMIFPTGTKGAFAKTRLTTIDDGPGGDVDDFYETHGKMLMSAQKDMWKFLEN